jgi:cytochrome c-type biogenesis protein CcmH/NrfG
MGVEDRVSAEPGRCWWNAGARRHLAQYPQDGAAGCCWRGWISHRTVSRSRRQLRKAIAASPKVAKDALIWCEYADALGMAQGGTLAGRPRELVLHALALDGAHPKALDMAGSEAYEHRDYATALRHWRQLLGQLAEGSPEHRELAAAIARVEQVDVAAVRPAGIRP